MEKALLPIRQYVLKVHSRCDLACDYCYMYEHADQSWRNRPAVMSDDTLLRTAARIGEHVEAHSIADVYVVFHGGEPLLAGKERIDRFASALRAAIDPRCRTRLAMQTNGVRLDSEWAELFHQHQINVAVSLDGDQLANDKHRQFRNGAGSYAKVRAGVDILRLAKWRHLYSGLLCTVDIGNDPMSVYDALMSAEPPALEFLLPHHTWDNPPTRPDGHPTAYADWLGKIFDRWNAAGRPVPIRFFDSIIETSWGGSTQTEALGLDPVDLVVIETDGTIELADSLKTAYDGAPATGLDVWRHSFDDAARHPGVVTRQLGVDELAPTCQSCPVVVSCGGGLYAHRYRDGHGFANPSVYCRDLFALISHIRRQIGWQPPTAREEGTVKQLRSEDLDDLAAGYGGTDAVRVLAGGQRQVRHALLRMVHQRVGRSEAAWDVLKAVERHDRQAFNRILDLPYVRSWAKGVLSATEPPAATYECTMLSLATTAAFAAGMTAKLSIPVSGNRLYLPTHGSVILPDDGMVVEALVEGNVCTVEVPSGQVCFSGDSVEVCGDVQWLPMRRLTCDAFSLLLDDSDPNRASYQVHVTSYLPANEVEAWQELFGAAWNLIQRHYGQYAIGMKAGLKAVTPLTPVRDGYDISGTLRDAFGAVGIARPADAPTLALLLIHEFQHAKLGAIFDMIDLYDTSETRLFAAPWREDPRPVEGLFQGCYAHIGVTEYWRTRRAHAEPSEVGRAAEQYEIWHRNTVAGIHTLIGSGALSPAGLRFSSQMLRTLEAWTD